jgi:hypothetical protein
MLAAALQRLMAAPGEDGLMTRAQLTGSHVLIASVIFRRRRSLALRLAQSTHHPQRLVEAIAADNANLHPR